jgi:hypothetical protein
MYEFLLFYGGFTNLHNSFQCSEIDLNHIVNKYILNSNIKIKYQISKQDIIFK